MKFRCLICEGQLRWAQLLTKQRFYFVFWFSIVSTCLTQHTYLNRFFIGSVEEVECKMNKNRNKYVGRKKFGFLHVSFLFLFCSYLWSGKDLWQAQGTRKCCGVHISELGSQLVLPFGESGDLLGPGWRMQVAGRQEVRTSFLPSYLSHNGLGVLKTESQEKSLLLSVVTPPRSQRREKNGHTELFQRNNALQSVLDPRSFVPAASEVAVWASSGGAGGIWKRAECGTLKPRSYRGSLPTRSTRDPHLCSMDEEAEAKRN